MKINGLILITVLQLSGFLYAQTDFRQGYILKESGDTLFGEIDYRGDLLMGSLCKFRIKEGDEIIEYSPDDIMGYRFNDYKYYISREIEGKKVFLEYLINGKVSIYYHRNEEGDHYYIEKDSFPLAEIPYEEEIKYRDGRRYFYTSKRHFGLLKYYMQDAPNFQSRIASVKKPEHNKLINLAEDYHHRVCKDDECIIYEKRQPLINVDVEMAGGYEYFHNQEDIISGNYVLSGLLLHFWLPRSNEKLHLRTGLVITTLSADNSFRSVIRVPLMLEYIYPKGNIRPKAAIGTNLYRSLYHSVAFMGGMNIRLYKILFWSINCDVNTTASNFFPLFPKSFISYSISTGIFIDL